MIDIGITPGELADMLGMTVKELAITIGVVIVWALLFAAFHSGRKDRRDGEIAKLERRLAELERKPRQGENAKDARLRDLKQRIATLEERAGS
jgi:hypothetical protein